jgi:hypothetical protein
MKPHSPSLHCFIRVATDICVIFRLTSCKPLDGQEVSGVLRGAFKERIVLYIIHSAESTITVPAEISVTFHYIEFYQKGLFWANFELTVADMVC